MKKPINSPNQPISDKISNQDQPILPNEIADLTTNNSTKIKNRNWGKILGNLIGSMVATALFLGVVGLFSGILIIWYYSRDIPNIKDIRSYASGQITRIYDGNGDVMAELSNQNRFDVPFELIPIKVRQAFISAEDQRFYEHSGLDYMGMARAIITNILNITQGKRPQGASTITQQLAKNMVLDSSEVSLQRKIKEAVISLRLEQTLSKDEILKLYLNYIYLGNRAYGVAAAAKSYFNKSLDELNIAEIAYLAALPKAPNNYHPVKKYDLALARRNWVISRMVQEQYITQEEADIAIRQPLNAIARTNDLLNNDYFVNKVRDEIKDKLPDVTLSNDGLTIRTSLNTQYQEWAINALHKGLRDYDRRHGFRGAFGHVDKITKEWQITLDNISSPLGKLQEWEKALVLGASPEKITIGLENGKLGIIEYEDLKWARKFDKNTRNAGAIPKNAEEVLKVGDAILVSRKDKNTLNYNLEQEPEIDGAIMAIDANNGRILAMVGGWSFERSKFNRATQAKRQPGSTAKPFTYLTALENSISPMELISDDRLIFQSSGNSWRETEYLPEYAKYTDDELKDKGLYRPGNFDNKYGDELPMRVGIEKSKNLMTLRLANRVGVNKVANTMERFGLNDNIPNYLSISLGGIETTLERLVRAYAPFANGGYLIQTNYIDRIQDRFGHTIYRNEQRECPACTQESYDPDVPIPAINESKQIIADPALAYIITDMLNSATIRGTSASLSELGHQLAGKTGTTNDNRDAWFVGFNNDIVVGVFTGMDNPTPLGKNIITGQQETGGSVALPIFKDFMRQYLSDKPKKPLRVPAGIEFVNMNLDTWTPTTAKGRGIVAQPIATDYFKISVDKTELAPAPKQILQTQPEIKETPLPIPKSQENNGLY